MTEIKGGSDLGANVETRAAQSGSRWLLSGEKYFASNVGAELAVVAARPEDAPPGVRGPSGPSTAVRDVASSHPRRPATPPRRW